MKTFLHTLIVVAAFLIQTTLVRGQYTYQTAVRANDDYHQIFTDSNVVLQAGIGIGNATVNTQPVWMVFGFCESGNLQIQVNAGAPSFSNSSISIVIYGPFTDTINIGSKLINSNIDTVHNAMVYTSNWSWTPPYMNYRRGDIYMVLMMSTTTVWSTDMQTFSPFIQQRDTAYCPFCDAKLSELYQPICTVTFDSASQKNKIIWGKDIFTAAQDYVVFRKNVGGTFDTLPYQSVSQLSEYVDATSSPLAKSEVYKLGIRDSCGNMENKDWFLGFGLTPVFTTMHLVTYPAGNNVSSLLWNKGSFNGPFLIYRTDPSGITTLIDSIGVMTDPQTYTDINAPAGLCSYQIGVNFNPPCVSSLLPSYNIVKSNPGYVTVTGINELADLSKAISIEPNPFNQFTKIDLHLFTKQNLKVILRNLTGQVVMQFDDVKTDELIIERNNLSQGLYFLEVTGKDFYARKKVVVD